MKTEHTTGIAKNTGLSEENIEAIGEKFFLFILIEWGISYVEVQLLYEKTYG